MNDETADDPRAEAFLREVARIDDLPPPTGELPPGARLGRFSIVSRLGAGAMGAVYEAKDETLGRTVAIKLMRRTTDEARRRFVQEARAAAAVSHPNLVTLHEVGEADGRAFIVMEHVRGKTLRAHLASRPSRAEAQRIMRDIARGVAAAHAAGIVHRDLKPDNVMIAADGTVKVVDFGIARIAAGSGDGAHAITAAAMTGTGAIVGTPSYMSPEQALGREVDARSDVYSFGVLAYELLTGTRPGPDPAPPEVSPQIDGVVTRCLAARREDRFADAGEVRDVLDGIVPPLVRAARRGSRPVIAVAAAASLALIVAGSALAVWRRQHAPDAHAGAHAHAGPLAAAPDVRAGSEAALAAYRGGFQLLRDSMYIEGVKSFEKAVELDPAFIAAHLRVGLSKRFFFHPHEAVPHFEIALKNRAVLDEHDQILLDAAEPSVMREPYDHAESRRRLLAARDRYPDDSEILYWLGFATSELGDFAAMDPILDRLATLDPQAAFVPASRAIAALYRGDRAKAQAYADECRRLAPTPAGCVHEIMKLHDDTGACSEMESALRGWATASPSNARVPWELARVLLAQDRPLPAVMDLFARSRAVEPAELHDEHDVHRDIVLAGYSGDFATLERLYREQVPWHPGVAANLVWIAHETGRPELARAAAEEFFARKDALPPSTGSSDMNLFHDHTGAMLQALARTGAISSDELERRRAEWLTMLDAGIGGLYRTQIWAQAYASGTYTTEEAAAAVAALPRELPSFYWFTSTYARVGRTLALAGKHDEALPHLERATRRCLERDPVAFLYLGQVQEARGDQAAACAAYATVVRRWGDAKPRSVTAEEARARATALACP